MARRAVAKARETPPLSTERLAAPAGRAGAAREVDPSGEGLEFGMGHNAGPSPELDEDPGALSWRHWCWKRAHKSAWKTPPREIALRRLARAEALGMTYHAYTLEIMERGKYL